MESAKAVLESASSGYGAAISAPGRTGAHHVRFGSKADIGLSPVDVCYSPKSGHSAA
jgi:hypothetical protein